MPSSADPLYLTPAFNRALVDAATLHASQLRKGTGIPYLAHLLQVAGLVLEDGGTETEAIAALLHDAVEDQGGKPTLERIRRDYGDDVANIVDACSDTDEVPKPPWRERKERYIAHLAEQPEEAVLRVSLADKVHNLRSIVRDLEVEGPENVLQRFSPGADHLWYYRTIASVYRGRISSPLLTELDGLVLCLERLLPRGSAAAR